MQRRTLIGSQSGPNFAIVMAVKEFLKVDRSTPTGVILLKTLSKRNKFILVEISSFLRSSLTDKCS